MQIPKGLHSQGPVSNSPILTQPPPPAHQGQFAGRRQPHSDEGNAQQSFQQGSAQQPFSIQGSTQQPYSSHGSAQQLPPGLPFVPSQQPSWHSGVFQHGSEEFPRQHSGVQIFPAQQPRHHQSLDHNMGLQTAGSGGWDHDLSSFNPNAGTSATYEDFASQHPQQLARPSFGRSSSGSSAQHAQHTAVTGLFQRMDVGSQMSHQQPSSSLQHGVGDDCFSSHLDDGQNRQSGQYGAGSSSFGLTNRPQLGPPSHPKRRPYEPHKQPPSPVQADQAFGFGHSRDHMQPQMHIQPSQEDGWDASTPQSYHQSQSDLHPHIGFGHQPSTRDQVDGSFGVYGSVPTDDEYGRASYCSSQNEHGFGLSQRFRSTGLAARTSSGKVLTVPRSSFTGAQGSHQSVDVDSPIEPQPGPPPGLDYSSGASTYMRFVCVCLQCCHSCLNLQIRVLVAHMSTPCLELLLCL